MFAVIKTGGKQYKVAENDVIKVEKLAGASNDTIEFEEILMVGNGGTIQIGTPCVAKAKVCGTILEQTKGDKIIVFKKKRRHNYRRKNGHRQLLTVIRITDILPEGGTAKARPAAVKAKAEPKVEAATRTPQAKAAAKAPAKAKATPKAKAEDKAPAKAKTTSSVKKTSAKKEK